jgi:phage-related holin
MNDRMMSIANLWPIKAAAALFFALFGPIRDAHVALFVVLIIDLITGVLAALKEHRVSSAVMRQKTFSKLLTYSIALIMGYQVEKSIMGTPYEFAGDFSLSAVLIYLVATEAISVLENVEKITGTKILSAFAGLRRIKKKLEEENQNGKQENVTGNS